MLTFIEEKKENYLAIKLNGSIDLEGSKIFEKIIDKIKYSTNLYLILDFGDVDYIGCNGMRYLSLLRENFFHNKLSIINIKDDVYETLKTTGFVSLINCSKENKSDVINSENATYTSLIKFHAKHTPNKIAFKYLDKTYTWKDIDVASQLLALNLLSQGVRKGSHVAICARNSINWVFCFYAIQKLGAIAVLINPNMTVNEIASLCEIADVKHLCYAEIPNFTEYNSFTNELLDHSKTIKHIYNISDSIKFLDDTKQYNAIKGLFPDITKPDDPIVIIFTSGTTGKPKAILLSSYCLLNRHDNFSKELQLSDKDYNLAIAPFFHLLGFVIAFAWGVVRNFASFITTNPKPEYLLSVIEKEKITMFVTVPALILRMIELPEFSSQKVVSLTFSMIGGAKISEAQMLNIIKLFSKTHFLSSFAMSECPIVSFGKIGESASKVSTTVGHPVVGIDMEIRDDKGNALPKNKIGEICVNSDFMFHGYYKNNSDTPTFDDRGYFKTGDLGYLDDDNYLHIAGRLKNIINRGGEKLMPMEIADALTKIPNVLDAVVFGIPHKTLGEEVAAALITTDNGKFNENEIKTLLKKSIAHYKVPSRFILFKKFPTLANGKVDMNKIKEMLIDKIVN